MMDSAGMSYLDLVGRLVAHFDVERVHALDLQSEVDDLPQRARLVEFDSDAERRMPGADDQPLLGTAEQRVSRRAFDRSVSVNLKYQYSGHGRPAGVVQHARIRTRFR